MHFLRYFSVALVAAALPSEKKQKACRQLACLSGYPLMGLAMTDDASETDDLSWPSVHVVSAGRVQECHQSHPVLSWPSVHVVSAGRVQVCHQSKPWPHVDAQERTLLSRQCLDWLQADLALRKEQFKDGKAQDHTALRWTLKDWQRDPDLAGIRDPAVVAKLPPDEQEACKKLWADVKTLLAKTREKAQDKQKEVK
jgi:hypothetical protein